MKTGSNGTHKSGKAVGIIFQAADGSIQSCNKEAENILGYTAEEMKAVPDTQTQVGTITHPASALGSCKSFTTAVTTRQPCSDVELKFCRSDGSLVWLLLDSQPLFSGDKDRPSGIITTLKDITSTKSDRPQNQSIEWQSDRNFTILANAIPGILYVYDVIERRYVYINDRTYSLLGYTSPANSRSAADFICQKMHPADFSQFFTHITRLHQAQEGEICKFEYRMRHQNGSWRWLCSQDWVSSRQANGLARQIIGIATDITQRKQTETALQQTEARLSENERLLQLALSNAKAGTWNWDIEGQKIVWSPENYDLYGITPQNKPLKY